MIKAVLERGLQAEMTSHLGYEKGDPEVKYYSNARNGTSVKTVHSEAGSVPLDIPRDRDGSFTPRLVPKGKRRLAVKSKAGAWIREWNALTPHTHWQLEAGEYRLNQEILVFPWYVIYRRYACVPDFGHERAFLQRARDLASEAARLHMHLLEGARTHHVAGQLSLQGPATRLTTPRNQ